MEQTKETHSLQCARGFETSIKTSVKFNLHVLKFAKVQGNPIVAYGFKATSKFEIDEIEPLQKPGAL